MDMGPSRFVQGHDHENTDADSPARLYGMPRSQETRLSGLLWEDCIVSRIDMSPYQIVVSKFVWR